MQTVERQDQRGDGEETERQWSDERKACWREFKAAADTYLATGDKNAATTFVTRVEGMFGAEVADQQRRELWNWIKARQKG